MQICRTVQGRAPSSYCGQNPKYSVSSQDRNQVSVRRWGGGGMQKKLSRNIGELATYL